MPNFWDYENTYKGETAWVLGSGRTLDFISPEFFDDKLVVATNAVLLNKVRHGFRCTNYWHNAAEWDLPTVMPDEWCVPHDIPMTKIVSENAIFVPTIPQKYAEFHPLHDWPEQGRFVVGPTSLHLSLHWAVWLGVSHIVLVGADCGFIDGENNLTSYYDQSNRQKTMAHAHHKMWENTLSLMAEKIREFGVSVHSLNPWITFNLEGHVWSQR